MLDFHDKQKFHREGRSILRKLAKALDLPAGSYQIRVNAGGPAVSGEVILHGEDVYVQLGGGWGHTQPEALVRSCKSRKDYVGGANNYLAVDKLLTEEGVARVQRLRRLQLPVLE